MGEESDKLKDYTGKINKVMKYTDGDIQRAQKIIQGNLKDFLVIKGKLLFEEKEESGLFLLFFHKYKHYLVDKYTVLQDNTDLSSKVSLTDSWNEFFAEINQILDTDQYIKDKVTRMNTQFEKEFSSAIISQMIGKLENRDLTTVTVQMENICSFALGDKNFFLQIDYEDMTSLEYEEIVKAAYFRSQRKMAQEAKEAEKKKAEAEPKSEETDEVAQERNRLMQEGNAIVNGELSLSPIKGKFISEVAPGDVISVRIKDSSPKAINIIKQLHLFTDEGKIKKTKGRVLYRKKHEAGFSLFVQIAPLVVIEVTEEEEIKVEHFPPQGQQSGKTGKKKKKEANNLPIIIISSVITAIIVLILIVFLAF
jgi:hypothetical protein